MRAISTLAWLQCSTPEKKMWRIGLVRRDSRLSSDNYELKAPSVHIGSELQALDDEKDEKEVHVVQGEWRDLALGVWTRQ